MLRRLNLTFCLGNPVVSQQANDPRHLDLEMNRADELVVGLLEVCTAPGKLHAMS